MRPRRILVVAYHFPPLGGGGVQRTVKHVKYLPTHNFDPVVVTTDSSVYHAKDDTLRADLPPALPVFRARELLWGRKLMRLAQAHRIPYLGSIAAWPDQEAGWIPHALIVTLRAIRAHRPDVLYTTSPPNSAHLVGLLASRLAKLPWVADFRDEWSTNPHSGPRPPLIGPLTAYAERLVTRSASRVVVAADTAEILGMPVGNRRRMTISNGVDEADLPPKRPMPAASRFRLSFVGSLYRGIDCAPVFEALRNLSRRGEIDPGRIEVRLVGNVGIANLDPGPIPMVRTGYVEHRRAFEEMLEAHALLSYVPAHAENTPGKIFEYLAADRPVLCVAGERNLASRLVRELDAGLWAHPKDVPGIEMAIKELYRRWQTGDLRNPPGVREAVLQRFSREKLAGDLARVLTAAIEDQGGSAHRHPGPAHLAAKSTRKGGRNPLIG